MTQHPSYYHELARAAAVRAGIDPDIFHNQINLESGFNPLAESYAGAQGIAQIIPRFHPNVDPWNPGAALDYAANLISGYLTNYGGDIRKALTAYHAGAGTLASAVELGGASWERFLLQGAQQHFGDATAQRVARDNANYLKTILGTGPTVFHLAIPKLRISRPDRPDIILEGEEARTFNFSKDFSERLKDVYANVFGRPAGDIPDEPFPGYNSLLKPFVAEFENTLLGIDFITLEIDRLNKEAPSALSLRGSAGPAIFGPTTTLLPVFTGLVGAIQTQLGVKEPSQRTQAINDQLAIRQQIFDALLTRYDDLSRLFLIALAQIITFQEIDPEVRANLQATEVDTRLANMTPQQLNMIQPIINTIKSYYGPAVDQLSEMTEDEIVAVTEVDIEDLLFTIPRAKPILLSRLTVDEIRLSFKGFTPLGPSEEMTGEEIRRLLQLQGLDDEEILEFQQDVSGSVAELLSRADEISANIAALKAGQGDWIIPQPGLGDYIRASAVQPLLVASVALEKYQNNVVRPIAGGGLLIASYLNPGEDGIERDFKEALKDENWWKALATAERKSDLNPVTKFAIETLADPTTYIGFGIAAKVIRPLPIIGARLSSIVAIAELNYIRMANAPFTGAFKLLGKIPKPASTIANLNRIQTGAVLDRFLTRFYDRKKLSQITSAETTSAFSRALEKESKFPHVIQDLGVLVGKILKSLPTPSADDITLMSQKAGGALTKESVISSKTLMLSVEQQLAKAVNDPKEKGIVARSLLTILQIEDNDAGKKATLLIVSQRIDEAEAQAQRLIIGNRTGSIIEGISQNIYKVSIANNVSQTAIQAGQLGRLSYSLKRVGGGLGVIWSNSIERFMIVPLARAYLLFPMYQAWNVVETAGKILFAGKNPIIKGNAAQRAADTWSDVAEGRIWDITMGRGRGLVAGEKVGDLGKAKTLLGKAYESVRRAFGESLAIPYQANAQAGFIDQVATNNLQRLRPTEWEAINKILKSVGTDFDFLPKELRGEARDLIISAIIRGPNAIRALSDDFTVERLRTFKLHELVAKYDHIDSPIQSFIVEMSETGRIWTETDKVLKEVDELIWHKYLTSPEHFALNFEAMIDELATAPINSWDDIAKRLITLQTANRTFSDMGIRQYRLVRESLKGVVDFRERDRIFDLYFSQMEIFSDKVDKGLSRYTSALQRHTEVAGDKALDIEVLMGKYKLQQEMVSETFAKVAVIRNQIFRGPGKRPKSNEEWVAALDKLDVPWQELTKAKESLNRGIFLAEAKLGGLEKYSVPNTLRLGILGRISRQDIATLYNIQADDVQAMTYLPDFQALMGKDEFTLEVLNRVAYNLNAGEEAATLGWTANRIGRVWGDIMREMRLDPKNVSAIAPTMLQFEDMTKEIMLAKMTVELPKGAKTGIEVISEGKFLRLPIVAEDISEEAGATVAAVILDEIDVLIRGEVGIISVSIERLGGKPSLASINKVQNLIQEVVALNPGKRVVTNVDNNKLLNILVKLGAVRVEGTVDTLDVTRMFVPSKSPFAKWSDDVASQLEDVPGYWERSEISEGKFLRLPGKYVFTEEIGKTQSLVSFEGTDLAIIASSTTIDLSMARITSDKSLKALGKIRDFLQEVVSLNPDKKVIATITNEKLEGIMTKLGARHISADVSALDLTDVFKPDILARPEGQLAPSWLAGKKQALSEASDEFFQTFPDYINLTYLDTIMRSQMPYWTYEFHRLFYLPRQFMRTPGLITGLGRYNEYTEGDNYFHLPFTSLEVNPLRGTILMGGLRRLLIRDYPEFYDTFPKVQQGLDIMGRFGFYPGAHVTLANMMFGSSSPQWNQLGEMVPVAAKAPIQGFQAFANATGNEALITAAERLANVFIPERFRNYMIGLKISDIGATDPETGKPISGADLINKKLADTPLTEFEQDLWTKATGELSVTFLLMDQTALLRFRPEEMQDAREALSEIVSEYTGLTIEQLEDMRKWGYRWEDVIPPNPEMRDLINTTEALQKWSGFTTVLFGASEQGFRARRNEFWDEIDQVQVGLRVKQDTLDCQFGWPGSSGCDQPDSITADTWISNHSSLGADYRSSFDSIRGQDRYKDIPVTREEVLAFFQKTGQALPIEHPEVELIRMFYDIQVEDKFNAETGKVEKDWFTFFARREMLLQAAGDARSSLEEIIERNETPLEKLWNWSYTQFLKPYYNRAELTISRFPLEHQIIIRQWLASDNPLDRDVLEDIQVGDKSLIGQYQKDIKTSGRQFRFYSPDTDAWLNFWRQGGIDSFRTIMGQDRYKALLSQYRPNYESIPGLEVPNEVE